jgi:hypothetical protein
MSTLEASGQKMQDSGTPSTLTSCDTEELPPERGWGSFLAYLAPIVLRASNPRMASPLSHLEVVLEAAQLILEVPIQQDLSDLESRRVP